MDRQGSGGHLGASNLGGGGSSFHAMSSTRLGSSMGSALTGTVGGGGPASPTFVDTGDFNIASVRTFLYRKLSKELRSQIAYRHFYTDELDQGLSPQDQSRSSVLSLKFFGSLVMYLCALFKLDGRRKQYEQASSEKAGREFATAHHRVQEVFSFLSTTYGTILMTYNSHNELVYHRKMTPQLKLQLSKGGPQTVGMKAPLPAVKKEMAFTYSSDELRFYEELYSMAEEMVKMAFNDDPELQTNAVNEVLRLFRSQSFTFQYQKRENEIRSQASVKDRQRNGLLHNNRKMVELLQTPQPPLVIKYAIQQRTPFIGSKFSGGTSFMRYQRVRKNVGELPPPSILEQRYSIQTERSTFPDTHPAMKYVSKRPTTTGSGSGSGAVDKKRAEVHASRYQASPAGSPNSKQNVSSARFPSAGGEMPSTTDEPNGGENDSPTTTKASQEQPKKYLPNLRDFDEENDDGEENESPQTAQFHKTLGDEPSPSTFAGDIATEINIRSFDRTVVSQRSVTFDSMQGSQAPVRRHSSLKNLQQAGKRIAATVKVLDTIDLAVEETYEKNEARAKAEAIATSGSKSSVQYSAGNSSIRRLQPRKYHQIARPEEAEDALQLHAMPDAAWISYNPKLDIDAIYQSMKYGTDPVSFELPSDIMACYDENGVFIPKED